jgi:Rieske Fe-S protein
MNRPFSRRQILTGPALLVAGECVCRAGSNCCLTPTIEPDSLQFRSQSIWIDRSRAPSIALSGSAVNIIDPERNLDIILVHDNPECFHALSGLCTHAGRPLSYQVRRNVLQCNNFGHAIFSLEGEVLKGPAARNLKRYRVIASPERLEIKL